MGNIIGVYGCRALHFYNLYASILSLDDFHGHSGNAHRHSCLGNILEVLEDEAVQRLGAVHRQIEAEFAVEAAQRACAIDHGMAFGIPAGGMMTVGSAG